MEKPDRSPRRWLVLGCATLLLLFLGLLYAWSNFVAPLESEFGWNRSDTSLAFTFCMSFFCLGGFVSGLLLKKVKPHVNFLLSALFVAAGFILASRLSTLGGLYLGYGVLAGFGIGISYNTVISSGMLWFPDKIGLASGIMLMGFGLGGFALGAACTNLITTIGWRSTFFIMGVAFGCLVLLASLLIRRPASTGGVREQALAGHTTGEMLREPSFWMIFAWATLLSAAYLALVGNASPLAQGMGSTPAQAALFTGIISIFNGTGRVLIGILHDRFPYKRVLVGVGLLDTIAFVVTYCALRAGNLVMLATGFALTGLAFGCVPPTTSVLAVTFFGKKSYSVNYALINMNLLISSFAGAYLAGALQTSSGSFLSTALVMIVFCAVSTVMAPLMNKPREKS